jgi:hypothetical protein
MIARCRPGVVALHLTPPNCPSYMAAERSALRAISVKAPAEKMIQLISDGEHSNADHSSCSDKVMREYRCRRAWADISYKVTCESKDQCVCDTV